MAIKNEHQIKDGPVVWMVGLMAVLIPGGGHLWLKCFKRGVVAGGAIWLIFIIGVTIGGHLYGSANATTGFLSYVFSFCNMGSGLLYLASWLMGIGLEERAYLVTSEYGNVFLIVAGLLNYIFAIDAFDIAAGRKK